mgnify:CR=1 FL=1
MRVVPAESSGSVSGEGKGDPASSLAGDSYFPLPSPQKGTSSGCHRGSVLNMYGFPISEVGVSWIVDNRQGSKVKDSCRINHLMQHYLPGSVYPPSAGPVQVQSYIRDSCQGKGDQYTPAQSAPSKRRCPQ